VQARPRRLVVVVGTGTEVGKTWLSARLLAAWRAGGATVAARKPAQSFDPADAAALDSEVLGAASGEAPDTVCPPRRSYPLAMAPPMAAARLGRPTPPLEELLGELRWPSGPVDVGLVECAGGLRSPQAADADALELASALAPDLVVGVAHAGLGTIHAVRQLWDDLVRRRLAAVVVLNRFDASDPLHLDNLEWLARRDGIDVVAGDDDGLSELARRGAAQAPSRRSTTFPSFPPAAKRS
jgi:dethiobiotin synthetase